MLDGVLCELADALLLIGLQRQAQQNAEKRVRILRVVGKHPGELGPQLEADTRLRLRDAEAEPAAEELANRPVRERLGVRDGVAGQEPNLAREAIFGFRDEP